MTKNRATYYQYINEPFFFVFFLFSPAKLGWDLAMTGAMQCTKISREKSRSEQKNGTPFTMTKNIATYYQYINEPFFFVFFLFSPAQRGWALAMTGPLHCTKFSREKDLAGQ
jgi:hypothetical protein